MAKSRFRSQPGFADCLQELEAILGSDASVDSESQRESAKKGDRTIELPGWPGVFCSALLGSECPSNDGRRVWFWLPRSIPRRRMLTIASSRVGKHPEKVHGWIDGLRTAVTHCDPRYDALLTAPGMTTHGWVDRLAFWMGILRIHLAWLPEGVDQDWFNGVCQQHRGPYTYLVFAFVLGERRAGMDASDKNPEMVSVADDIPDRLPMLLADEVRLLSVRAGGNIHRLALERLSRRWYGPRLTCLLHRAEGQSPVETELIARGATPWILQRFDCGESRTLNRVAAKSTSRHRGPTAPSPIAWDAYLAHATRAPICPPRRGDAVENESYDRYLFGEHDVCGPLLSLIRILAGGHIAASRFLIRGSVPVVCFTEQRVDSFSQLKKFRPHLSRWDFESFGIAIRRTTLTSLGARPVIYGDNELWRNLPDDARPYFQISRSQRGGRVVDWTIEREWRLVGDLDLRRIPVDDAIVFVAEECHVEIVEPYSRWPVVAVGGGRHSAAPA